MPETEGVASTKTWEGAAAPGAAGRVRRFEAAWRDGHRGARPRPRDFLPEEPADRPAVLFALLRAEIGLRWDDGDRATVESYRDLYPELDADGLVALIYEEFCLREETGEAPVSVEYDERFPELAARLRRVFDIHDLVGQGGSAAFRAATGPDVPFPESGQTTAGFRLLEELGRGSFARVFLAEERQLADRPVALKVSRAGSREPQTLARLQHTHIVPVHSSRTDPATGLHLLCMPYFGRVTLERLLAEPGLKTAATGADVLAALDRLDPTAGPEGIPARSAFAGLPYARALAWWGARMAEALAHAHERGVLHRDIKPSNVLITADGLPMLLDFNLARDPRSEASGPSMGGTLAYMAPEHLDALAVGHDDGASVGPRADLFALGVLLFEALTGRRPFEVPAGATSVADTLRRAAEGRRVAAPSIRSTHPEIPEALEAVVLKCLAVDPACRHPDASALAADLQAVADDGPLAFAREPFLSRSARWARRNRWPIALAGLLGVASLLLSNALARAAEDQRRVAALLSAWVAEAEALAARPGCLPQAVVGYAHAVRLAESTPDFARQPPLLVRRDEARSGLLRADARLEAARLAAVLGSTADAMLARPPRSPEGIRVGLTRIDAAVGPFLDPARHPMLDGPARDRAIRRVESLLFARVLLLRKLDPADRDRPLSTCALGERSARDKAPWDALRARLLGASEPVGPPAVADPRDAGDCVLLGLLAEDQGRIGPALAWFERAARLDPGEPGPALAVARLSAAAGDLDRAVDSVVRAIDTAR